MDGDWKERWAKDEAEIHQLIFLFVHFHCTHLPSIAEVTDASRWDFFSAFRPMMWRDEKRFAFAGFQKGMRHGDIRFGQKASIFESDS